VIAKPNKILDNVGFRSIAPRSRSVPQGYVYVPQLNLPYNEFSGLTEQY